MSARNVAEQVRWQDLKVRSELDMVFDIAAQEGWKDCEVFGSGDMITQPQESKGWKLIPADLYQDSIPPQAVGRLHLLINAGIRVRGVIIADDQRREEPAPVPAPAPAPARPGVFRSLARSMASWGGGALHGSMRLARAAGSFSREVVSGLIRSAGAVLSFSGKALLVLLRIAAVGALAAFGIYALLHYFWPVMILGFMMFLFSGAATGTNTGTGSRIRYDPKLVVLVDDGSGGTTWVSLFTWYD